MFICYIRYIKINFYIFISKGGSNMNLNAVVVGKLAEWKEKRGATNREIAVTLGVTDALIGQYLNRNKQLPNTRFEQVAKMLGVTLDELLSNGEETYKIHLRGQISTFSGELGLDRVIARIEERYLNN